MCKLHQHISKMLVFELKAILKKKEKLDDLLYELRNRQNI